MPESHDDFFLAFSARELQYTAETEWKIKRLNMRELNFQHGRSINYNTVLYKIKHCLQLNTVTNCTWAYGLF